MRRIKEEQTIEVKMSHDSFMNTEKENKEKLEGYEVCELGFYQLNEFSIQIHSSNSWFF